MLWKLIECWGTCGLLDVRSITIFGQGVRGGNNVNGAWVRSGIVEKESLQRSSNYRDPETLSEPYESSERIHIFLFLVAMDTGGMLWRNRRAFSLSCLPTPVQPDECRKDQQHYQQGEYNRIDLCQGEKTVYRRNSRNRTLYQSHFCMAKAGASDSSTPSLERVASCMVGLSRAAAYLSVPVCW